MLSGAWAQYYDGEQFNELRGWKAVDVIGGYNLGYPNVPADRFSKTYQGFIRPFVTGFYKLQCRWSRGSCSVFLNGTLMTSTPYLLQSNYNYRYKVEYSHTTSTYEMYFEWSGPEQFSNASFTTFASMPSSVLLHEAVCSQGCGSRGCCVQDDVCSCPEGWGGSRCEIELATCGADAPRNGTVVGGLRAKYYNVRLDDAPETANASLTQLQSTMSFDYGYNAAPGVGRDEWTIVYRGMIKSQQTGWHTFRVATERIFARLIIGGQKVFDWVESYSASIYLHASRLYDIRFDVQHWTSSASTTLYWDGPNFFEVRP
jgi:hypothetical protein